MTHEEFIWRCKAQNWWSAFVRNLRTLRGDEGTETYLRTHTSVNYINDAFGWGGTDEGFDYWCNIDDEVIKWGQES